jgi:hypothetical protein
MTMPTMMGKAPKNVSMSVASPSELTSPVSLLILACMQYPPPSAGMIRRLSRCSLASRHGPDTEISPPLIEGYAAARRRCSATDNVTKAAPNPPLKTRSALFFAPSLLAAQTRRLFCVEEWLKLLPKGPLAGD